MIDYHVHPDFSQDAEGSISEYCARAVELGMEEICFTTHYEPDPARRELEYVRVRGTRWPVASNWVDAYLAEITASRARFKGLVILAGIEVGYEIGLEGTIHDFLAAHPFDFVLGAVHCLDHVAITASEELGRFRAEYAPLGPEHVARRYYEYVRAAASSQLFDCIAHLDIYRKYMEALFDETFGLTTAALAGPALKAVARSGTGLEVNSSALRRGTAQPYPDERLIRMSWDAGVRTFTVGSDAHRPGDLGRDLQTVEQALASLGIRPARFRQRRRIG